MPSLAREPPDDSTSSPPPLETGRVPPPATAASERSPSRPRARNKEALKATTRVTASGSKTMTRMRMNHFTTLLTAAAVTSRRATESPAASASATPGSKARATNLKEPMSVALISASKSRICCSASSFFARSSDFFPSSSAELSGPKLFSVSLNWVIFLLASAISFSSVAIRSSTEERAFCRLTRAARMLSACSAPPVVRAVIWEFAVTISFCRAEIRRSKAAYAATRSSRAFWAFTL